MNHLKTIEVSKKVHVAYVFLNRPEVHNALNETMMGELTDTYRSLNHDKKIRLIVLQGRGSSFCAGADLQWMVNAQSLPFEQNFEDSLSLARCFYEIYTSKKITLAIIHGTAYGGANGLVAACDYAMCGRSTSFAFSEVRLGLIPATIAPYVIRKIGVTHAKDLMISAQKFSGTEAEKIGMVNTCIEDDTMSSFAESFIQSLLENAPRAQQNIKQLIHYLAGREINKELVYETAEFIANARITEEAKEGIKAFFEKRNPSWKTD
jgi:methylglutaconyl-CoA hydratase